MPQQERSPPPNHPDESGQTDAMNRRWPRHDCEMHAAIVILDDGAPALRLPVRVSDISRGGAGIKLDIPVERGLPIVFVLAQPVAGGKRAIYALSAGCRAENGGFHLGIEFLPTPLQIRCQPWYRRLNAA